MKPCQAWIAVGVLVAGCAGQATRPPATNVTEIPEQRNWFCQPGASGDGWQCIQNAQLAEHPKPTRPPPPSRAPAPSTAGPEDVPGRPSSDASATPGAAVPRGDVDADNAPAPPDDGVSPVPTAGFPKAHPPTASPSPSDTAAVPDYQRLAYHPAQPRPIRDLPDDYYALQVLAMPSRRALDRFIGKHRIRGASGARVESGGGLYYVLLLGIYETRAAARQAAATLPPPFGEVTAWVRSLGSLKSAMKRADVRAGRPDAQLAEVGPLAITR